MSWKSQLKSKARAEGMVTKTKGAQVKVKILAKQQNGLVALQKDDDEHIELSIQPVCVLTMPHKFLHMYAWRNATSLAPQGHSSVGDHNLN